MQSCLPQPWQRRTWHTAERRAEVSALNGSGADQGAGAPAPLAARGRLVPWAGMGCSVPPGPLRSADRGWALSGPQPQLTRGLGHFKALCDDFLHVSYI